MTPSIVCGIDGSPGARQAFDVAAALAERLALRLVLVHVAQGATAWPAEGSGPGTVVRHAGQRILSDMGTRYGVPDADRRLETGDPVTGLTTAGAEEEAELIVVGSGGEGTLRAAVLGSVSLGVVRDAPCPVVVVPPGANRNTLEGERIVCAVHGSEDRPAVVRAARLARGLGVTLTLTNVLAASRRTTTVSGGALAASFDQHLESGPRQGLRLIQRLLQEAGEALDRERHEICLRKGNPADELLEMSAHLDVVLLVVGSRGHGPLRSGLLSSVSRALARRADVPVVVCHQQQPSRPSYRKREEVA